MSRSRRLAVPFSNAIGHFITQAKPIRGAATQVLMTLPSRPAMGERERERERGREREMRRRLEEEGR